MALIEVTSREALVDLLTENKNVVMTFSAHWCGPCKASKPQLEQMAQQYADDSSKDVTFGIAYESDLGEAIHQHAVRAFPTYVLYQRGSEVNRVEGVNFQGITAMIEQAGCAKELTGGQTLSTDGTVLTPEQARAARLARLGASPAPAPMPGDVPAEEAKKLKTEEPATPDVEMNEATETTNDDKMQVDDDEVKDGEEAKMVDPTENLNPEHVKTLTESMGFSLIRAQKGLLNGNGETVEAAVEWLMAHQDDADIDDPIALRPEAGAAQSYKCNECGRVLANMANLELHANKTGHSDFEESTQAVKPLTAEEKAAKIAEIKELLKAKRAEREEEEKVDHVQREKARRLMGKEMAKTREEMEKEQRKRDALARKREKQAFAKERARIKAELEKDKLERQANKGKLSSRLGVDGYNPDGIQYDVDAGEGGEPQSAEGQQQQKEKKSTAKVAKIDEYISKISSYKAGGDGGKCLKILKTYIGNAVDQPHEEKFRSINMENKAFKLRVKPLLGAKQILLAAGFSPNEAGDAMQLAADADPKLLEEIRAKLEAAFTAYG